MSLSRGHARVQVSTLLEIQHRRARRPRDPGADRVSTLLEIQLLEILALNRLDRAYEIEVCKFQPFLRFNTEHTWYQQAVARHVSTLLEIQPDGR